ncbi:sigma-70 family RNA polymerase sigma factor, partial [Enterococcus casseliflavus]|uniref:sigma-70 family RNA polymerase sigma factor n=1 Tax=Enterococcus casseliflavus TaxID=37734 RepID=UPI003D108DDF
MEQVLNLPLDLRVDFERLDDALAELRTLSPEKAKVVELRYFAGLSIQETADVLDVAPATVKRHWTFARAWLYRAL